MPLTPNKSWCVYILRCGDGTFYTGCTNDLDNRLAAHQAGTGAKYTRSHLPVKLAYFESQPDRSSAQKREHELKQLSHEDKKRLTSDSYTSAVISH